ncbi:MAG: DoxX family protein [Edaphobacter sp.]|uniref:DoxX family protein n=1 Tax=Edaphobacter sp. TaxID=1934404 RepID=UPI00238CF84C|nr:DoxX family protein [Edaphobacter sp.]MDE1177645.1 DoxX family protein [Edaphobacter sp.]
MNVLARAASIHQYFCNIAEKLASPFLLLVRLYWGWQFTQTGLGKLHNQPKIVEFFSSLNIPFPALNAHFVSGLEFFGGILLFLGLFSRPISFLLTCSMFVAYWTADHEALLSVFSNPEKFYGADPYTFLFAALLILLFGPGIFSLDALIATRFHPYMRQPRWGANAVAD